MKKLFSKRHYEWLAHFAGANMSIASARHLAEALVDTNDQYDMQKFLETYHRIRNVVKAHDRMHEVAAALPPYRSREAGAARLYNEAADAAVNEALATAGIAVLPWKQDAGVMVPVPHGDEHTPHGDVIQTIEQAVEQVEAEAVASVGEPFDEYLRRHKQEAIEAGVDALFQYHRCYKCSSGRASCVNGDPASCRFVYAVND